MKHNIHIHKAEPNTGVLDYSHLLDAPAGKHGFVKVKKGHLYFEDGTRARFLGFNVAARSNTPDHETAEKLAARFASLGVNVIRLHAADAPIGEEPCSWSSCDEAPLLDYKSGSSRGFNPEGLDRFDYFVAKLREKGIYLHLDLIVARNFTEGDNLDYPGNPGSCIKSYTMYNERMIELQKEYARRLLCHVNPYTGFSLINDPAVMTIQLNNEDSTIKAIIAIDGNKEIQPYRDEVQKRFNNYLLMKYYTLNRLKEAWTYEGVCALGDDENPDLGTVQIVSGSFCQPTNEPTGQWDGKVSPARYADYMEFCIQMNRKFYQSMKDYLHSLGAKVPIVTSNLLGGAADVYGHIDGDIMENNSYFNHPLLPVHGNTYLVAGPIEYASVNPLTMQIGMGSMATSIVSFATTSRVDGKPFILSEWNEYGEHPFHSTAPVHTVAYACLNDWDGLILYNHHTSEKWDNQPADEILNIFDVYNDPAVICQWGFMASVFLKGLVAPAKNCVDIVFTQNDLKTLPNMHAMPNTFLPYITAMRNVFLDGQAAYQGVADVAINAGFFNGANLSEAKHSVYYAWSPHRDAMRRYKDEYRLPLAAKGSREIQPGVHLSEQSLVFDEIAEIAGNGDYRSFAMVLDKAMKEWGVMPEGTGYVDGVLISDTGEIVFDPSRAKYQVRTSHCSFFSGATDEKIILSNKIEVESRNERITLSLIPATDASLDEAKEFVLTAMGNTGMDETTYNPGPEIMGFSFTEVAFRGKLYADTLEGIIHVKSEDAVLKVLNPVGDVIGEIVGERTAAGVVIKITGEIPGVQYHLTIR